MTAVYPWVNYPVEVRVEEDFGKFYSVLKIGPFESALDGFRWSSPEKALEDVFHQIRSVIDRG